MAAFHGFAGSVAFPSDPTEIDPINVLSWSVDTDIDMAEITAMGDTWKTYLAGFKDWTATAECLLDSTGPDIGALGDNAVLVMTAVTDTAVSGNAIFIDMSVSTDANDVAKMTLSFKGSGELS